MAIPDNYIDHFNKDGDKRYISPAADKVRVDNENFEGSDLDQVLNEISESIGEAGQVNEIIMNGEPYTPTNKVIDLGTVITQHQDISGKVDKVTGKGLSTNDFTTALLNKLNGIAAGAQVNTINSIQTHEGQALTPDSNGIVTLPEQTEVEAVSVTTNQDGTFTIHVGDTDYTINLNHTHENMAKLEIVDEEPSDPAMDTIYALVDDASDPTEIQSLWIAGLEFVGGGGSEPDNTPKLTSPRPGATIDFDGQSTATVIVKGRNLVNNLSLVATGDFTVTANGQSVSTIDVAAVTDGASLTLLLTKGSNFVGGTIEISSIDLDDDVTLNISDSSVIFPLTGVKFTGTQWLETDYKANTKTEFILRCKLETNSITDVLDNVNRKNWILGGNDAQGCYELYHISQGSGAPYNLVFSINSLSSSNTINSNANNMLADPLIIQYNKTDGRLTAGTASTSVTAKTGNNSANLRICCRLTSGEDVCYSRFYLTIYEFTIIEDGENVRHYIPMRRFGSPGLYDTVTGSFLTSRTNDPLVEVNS